MQTCEAIQQEELKRGDEIVWSHRYQTMIFRRFDREIPVDVTNEKSDTPFKDLSFDDKARTIAFNRNLKAHYLGDDARERVYVCM